MNQQPQLAELEAQRRTLEAQIEAARTADRRSAISQIRSLMRSYQITQAEITRPPNSTKGMRIAPKFRDPGSGATWTGRGKEPRWIQGQDRAQFAIQ